jgi:hypothetical protein
MLLIEHSPPLLVSLLVCHRPIELPFWFAIARSSLSRKEIWGAIAGRHADLKLPIRASADTDPGRQVGRPIDRVVLVMLICDVSLVEAERIPALSPVSSRLSGPCRISV